MFYILTYSTHSEKYFELLKTYPQLIILGYGKKWNGFKDKTDAVVSFCKKINSDDIVCFVDGFDSIILESSTEILKRFKELNKDLIFSKDLVSNNFFEKYIVDIYFGLCKHKRLNSGLYIGKASAIIEIWKGMKSNMDDQQLITQKCINGSDIYIDSNHYIFYNYSSKDKITVKNKKLYINDNTFNTCIISAPGNKDIKYILKKLDYKNIDLIKKNKNRGLYLLKTYILKFIPEIILLSTFIFIFIFIFFRLNYCYLIVVVSMVLFLELIYIIV